MERKNENGDATDQDENAQMDENAQNPESPEIITLSSGDEDDAMDADVSVTDLPDDEMDIDVSEICLPSTSSGPSKSKQQFDEVTFQVKKEFMEETSKTEVSSTKANHLDGNKASEYLAEVGKRLKNFQQQSSAASYAAGSTSNSTTVTPSSQQQSHHQSSVSLPNSNDSQDLSEAENVQTEQQPSSWSTAASSVDAYGNNSMTVTAQNHSSVSSQPSPRLCLRRCDRDAMEIGAKVWREKARPVQAVPRVVLRNCDQDAMEMGAEVWRHEKIVWAPFGKKSSYWPGVTFQDFHINKVNKPRHKFVLWFGSHNYSEVRKDQLFEFRQHFDEKFEPKIRPTKKKAVLEALKLLAEMSNINQSINLLDWAMSRFPGFENRDEVLIEFLRPYLEKLK